MNFFQFKKSDDKQLASESRSEENKVANIQALSESDLDQVVGGVGPVVLAQIESNGLHQNH